MGSILDEGGLKHLRKVSADHRNRAFIWYKKDPPPKHRDYLRREKWVVKCRPGTDAGLVGVVTTAAEKLGLQDVDVMSVRLWYLVNDENPTWPDLPTGHVDQPQCWGQYGYNRREQRWPAPVPPTGKKVVLLTINIDSTIPPYKVGVRSTSPEPDNESYTEYVFSVGFNDAYALCGVRATRDTHSYAFVGDRKHTVVAAVFAKNT